MKLELIRRSERTDYVCYGSNLEKHGRKNKLFKIYLPSYIFHNHRFAPERFIIFCSVTDMDETKHICHKCFKTYPKYQYAKHAKSSHRTKQ